MMHTTKQAAVAALVFAYALAGCRSAAPPPDDAGLNTAVQSRLAGDPALSAEPIQVSVTNGAATLQGTVSSEAARALAANDAAQVSGVRTVIDRLTVCPGIQAAATLPHSAAPQPAPAPPSKPAKLAPSRPVSARPTYTPPSQPATVATAPIERRSLSNSADQPPARQPLPPTQPPAPPQPSFRTVTIPSGTTLPIRITQTLSSATAQPGDTFSGTLASDLVIDGLVALPAGTTVGGRVDQVQEAAHFKGSALLTLSLASINRRGERTTISTEPYTQEGKGRGKNTATKVGGGAAVGAILGGILGGGKGAAIGAATGGGVGAGANGITRGEQVEIPSETLLRFRLADSLQVKASTAAAGDGETNLQRHPSN